MQLTLARRGADKSMYRSCFVSNGFMKQNTEFDIKQEYLPGLYLWTVMLGELNETTQ